MTDQFPTFQHTLFHSLVLLANFKDVDDFYENEKQHHIEYHTRIKVTNIKFALCVSKALVR